MFAASLQAPEAPDQGRIIAGLSARVTTDATCDELLLLTFLHAGVDRVTPK